MKHDMVYSGDLLQFMPQTTHWNGYTHFNLYFNDGKLIGYNIGPAFLHMTRVIEIVPDTEIHDGLLHDEGLDADHLVRH